MASWVSNHLDVRSTWAVATVKDVTRYSQMWGRDRRLGSTLCILVLGLHLDLSRGGNHRSPFQSHVSVLRVKVKI